MAMIDIYIQGQPFKALLSTASTKSFIQKRVLGKFNPPMVLTLHNYKAHSLFDSSIPVTQVLENVLMEIKSLQSEEIYLVDLPHINDFDVCLGMDFINAHRLGYGFMETIFYMRMTSDGKEQDICTALEYSEHGLTGGFN